MGCLLDKEPAYSPESRPYYPQQWQQHQQAYNQPGPYAPQAPAAGYERPCGNANACYDRRAPLMDLGCVEPPFLRTEAKNGLSWGQYVLMQESFVDVRTGLLAGPWAECISHGVLFEHSKDWQQMPEYFEGGPPVQGIMTALQASVQDRPEGAQLMDAAARLEAASHEAVRWGRPLPGLQQGAPPFGMQQANGQQPPYGQEQPSGQQLPYDQQPPYGQAYGQHQHYDQQMAPPGPTLLGRQGHQGGGTGAGGKAAMVAGGVAAAGAGALGGYFLAEHMDDVGAALNGAGQWVEGAGETAAGWAGGAVGDVEHFVEDLM